MTDRELLERAAKAAGYVTNVNRQAERDRNYPEQIGLWNDESTCWNSLEHDGHALRLAVKLGLSIWIGSNRYRVSGDGIPGDVCSLFEGDRAACIRRAITRAAAALAKDTP